MPASYEPRPDPLGEPRRRVGQEAGGQQAADSRGQPGALWAREYVARRGFVQDVPDCADDDGRLWEEGMPRGITTDLRGIRQR